jgi:hypothetical protein
MLLVERTAGLVARAIEGCANGEEVQPLCAPETSRDLLRAALSSDLLRVGRRGGAIGLAILTGSRREQLTAAFERIREHRLPRVAAGRVSPEAIALSFCGRDESQTRSMLRRVADDLERALHLRTSFETMAGATESADGLLARLEQAVARAAPSAGARGG